MRQLAKVHVEELACRPLELEQFKVARIVRERAVDQHSLDARVVRERARHYEHKVRRLSKPWLAERALHIVLPAIALYNQVIFSIC